jgi:hypothetical protein
MPRYSLVTMGSRVTFPNRDRSRHHVRSFSPVKAFEIRPYVGLPADPIDFDEPGIVSLGCNIHDWMYAFLYVVDAPIHALTNE